MLVKGIKVKKGEYGQRKRMIKGKGLPLEAKVYKMKIKIIGLKVKVLVI